MEVGCCEQFFLSVNLAEKRLVLTIVFAMSTLPLFVCLACIKIVEQKEQSFEKKIDLKNSGYFRTPEEQVIFEEQYNRLAAINDYSPVTSGTPQDNCTFSCPIYRSKRSPSQTSARQVQGGGNTVAHGCCLSKPTVVRLDTAEDLDGNKVTLLQLENQYQYFQTETCQHADGCTGCRCIQFPTYTSAVVLDTDGDSIIKQIKVPGCCKCVNVGR
ncbi:hypothetical protein BsWGS_24976 [Bradybaena similaris]